MAIALGHLATLVAYLGRAVFGVKGISLVDGVLPIIIVEKMG